MPHVSTENNSGLMPFDPRWRTRVGAILDVIAILEDIRDCIKFINSHATRANPLDVAVNLRRIHEESNRMTTHVDKIRGHLWKLQAVAEEDIYRSWEARKEENMGNGNGKGAKIKTKKTSLKTKRNKFRRTKVTRGK